MYELEEVGNELACNLTKSEWLQGIKDYCTAIDGRLVFLVGVIFVMYIIEPLVYRKLKKWNYSGLFVSYDTIYWGYKSVLAGLIFMVGYAMLIRGNII
jgi:hypothetical protein